MKVCGISDLHGNLINNIPECDVLCIAGDIIPLQIQRKYFASIKWWLKDFCNWVKELPCKKVIFTAGNHDIVLERLYESNMFYRFVVMLEQYSNNKAILLINRKYEYKGITFYGFPYIRPIGFQEGRWAFEDTYEGINNLREYSCIRNIKADIFITHDNPFKNIVLMNYTKNPPKIWFYGHWHEGKDAKELGLYNCSIINNYYNMKEDFNIPTVDIETKDTIIENIIEEMQINISRLTAIRQYDSHQVKAIKDFLEEIKKFLIKQQEDDIPLPVTGEVIEEDEKDED